MSLYELIIQKRWSWFFTAVKLYIINESDMQMNQSVQSLYELFTKNLMQINIWLSHGGEAVSSG